MPLQNPGESSLLLLGGLTEVLSRSVKFRHTIATYQCSCSISCSCQSATKESQIGALTIEVLCPRITKIDLIDIDNR
jgi:hypothetical protein